MRTAYALAMVALVGAVVAAVHGCGSRDCCGVCPADQVATFLLSCTAPDLTAISIVGPCAKNARPSITRGADAAAGAVFVQGQSPGVCHVALTFVTGFSYAKDVTFASRSGGVCGGPQSMCGDFLAPTSGTFIVNNPSDTCVAEPDSGEDAGVDVSEETVSDGGGE